MLLLRNKDQQQNIRSQLSQPASAGKGGDMSELQAHHCTTPLWNSWFGSRLFTSYVKNRQQFVFANGVQSDKLQITCGVPQGSTLGPVLFLLYINDLSLSSNFFCNIFADDTALHISDTDPNNLEKKTNIDINSVFNWLQKNKLTLNLSKTKTILFNNHNRPVTLNINCNNVPLEQVNSTKCLGTTIDSNLTWKEQIASVEKKVAQGCHALF